MIARVRTDADIDELSNSELVEKALDAQGINLHQADGLSDFFKLIGYQTLEDFFSDNPGASESVVEWVSENLSSEQRTELEGLIPLDDEPTDEKTQKLIDVRQQLHDDLSAALEGLVKDHVIESVLESVTNRFVPLFD